jgi:hypothetical protein
MENPEMFELNRRHWFAGVTALVVSTLSHRGTAAAQETPAMSDPYPSNPTVAPNSRDASMDDADLLDLSEITEQPRSVWVEHLQAVEDLGVAVMARERAVVQQACDRLVAAHPDLLTTHFQAYDVLDVAISALADTSWGNGLLVGYALAHRGAPALVYTRIATPCPDCDGDGTVRQIAVAAYHPRRAVPLPGWVPDPAGKTPLEWMMAYHHALDVRDGLLPDEEATA